MELVRLGGLLLFLAVLIIVSGGSLHFWRTVTHSFVLLFIPYGAWWQTFE